MYIKRPPNSFMLWAQTNRPILSAENSSLTNSKISTLLGQQWKTLSNDEKKSYKDKAEQVKQEHKIQFPNYKYRPEKKIGTIKTIKTIKPKSCKNKTIKTIKTKSKSCKRKTTRKIKTNISKNENYMQLTININKPKQKHSLDKKEIKDTPLTHTINSEMKLNINFNDNWLTYNEGYNYYEDIELFYSKL